MEEKREKKARRRRQFFKRLSFRFNELFCKYIAYIIAAIEQAR
jgi:hypothetical protein